jgi:hypothetical protein
MAAKKKTPGLLPTERATKAQTVVLVQSLLVTWNVLDHLESKGLLRPREEMLKLRAAAGCCAPDGGSCCVNRKPF